MLKFIKTPSLAGLKNSRCKIDLRRSFATRSEFDSPLDHLPRFPKQPWINTKTTLFFFLLGSALAYNETLFNFYADITNTDMDAEVNRKKLEYHLKNMPIYERLAHPKPGENWIMLRSNENFDKNVLSKKIEAEYEKKGLTNSTLKSNGGITVEPVIFHNLDTDEGVTIVHAGYKLCGYPFLVHGGIIATLLNETFKRNASLSNHLESNVKGDFKVENLSISYKNPTLANQFLVIKTKPVNIENAKQAKFEGVIESEKGKVLVKSEASLLDTGRESNKGSWWK